MRRFTKRELFLACLIAAAFAQAATLLVEAYFHPRPRLVGYGCIGTTGPIYAEEEDHFPSCIKIERN